MATFDKALADKIHQLASETGMRKDKWTYEVERLYGDYVPAYLHRPGNWQKRMWKMIELYENQND